jgi:hypothetical protein
MSLYATLADVRSEMNAEDTVDDKKVMRGLRQVSARVDQDLKRGRNLFVPTLATRSIALTPYTINSLDRTLALSLPLLTLDGVSIGSQVLSVGSVVNTSGDSPYMLLQLACCAGYSWYGTCADGDAASITGVWGYHDDYANAWLAVDELAAALDASDTTLTVVDVDGENAFGDLPRISAGALLQIDDEWLDVTATDTDDNTVTVRRGVNGSTAAAHDDGATVSVYQVYDGIRRAVVRQCAFQYARRGAYETRRVQDLTSIDFPADTLAEWNALLNTFANL